jgi:hypothetical protein|uniref:Uncharacterized protein n=1 Tax=Picea glauca TaxID=3330 RepID=A0A101LXG8_PICGL|nr:hypothetical protein ABT39_MTgene6170 [Picea glauca]
MGLELKAMVIKPENALLDQLQLLPRWINGF